MVRPEWAVERNAPPGGGPTAIDNGIDGRPTQRKQLQRMVNMSTLPRPVTNSAAPSLLATSCLEQTGASPRIRSTNGACVPPQNPRKAPCPNSSSTISSFTDVRAKLSDLQRIEAVLEELEPCCCAAKGDVHCPMSQALQEAPRWSS